MTDAELRKLVEAVTEKDRQTGANCWFGPDSKLLRALAPYERAYIAAVSPDVLLALLDEKARLREALRLCVNNLGEVLVPGDMDWACVACHPESTCLVDGFRCGLHAGRAALESSDER